MASESLDQCFLHHWSSPPSSDSRAQKAGKPQFSATKKNPCATTNDKHGVRKKARKGLTCHLPVSRGKPECPCLLFPIQMCNPRDSSKEWLPWRSGRTAALEVGENHCPGVGLMAMESIWQRGCGYCVLGGKGLWSCKGSSKEKHRLSPDPEAPLIVVPLFILLNTQMLSVWHSILLATSPTYRERPTATEAGFPCQLSETLGK